MFVSEQLTLDELDLVNAAEDAKVEVELRTEQFLDARKLEALLLEEFWEGLDSDPLNDNLALYNTAVDEAEIAEARADEAHYLVDALEEEIEKLRI